MRPQWTSTLRTLQVAPSKENLIHIAGIKVTPDQVTYAATKLLTAAEEAGIGGVCALQDRGTVFDQMVDALRGSAIVNIK